LTGEDFTHPGVEVGKEWTQALSPQSVALVLLKVKRWGREWGDYGLARYQAGDRRAAVAAWERAVAEDSGAWEAMNNLAWLALEDGHLEDARRWIDLAMEHEQARESPSVRDTEFAVRRAEGGEGKDVTEVPGGRDEMECQGWL
jgi:tetratricopeptide (TPR) repeat protein